VNVGALRRDADARKEIESHATVQGSRPFEAVLGMVGTGRNDAGQLVDVQTNQPVAQASVARAAQ
jgi:hypothetical protein